MHRVREDSSVIRCMNFLTMSGALVTEELSLPDRAKLKELERENRELRLMNDFLKKTAAYFAREQQ
jgi:transposase-like protein